jgi:hypothetical protein
VEGLCCVVEMVEDLECAMMDRSMNPCARKGCSAGAMDGAELCLDHLRESFRDKALEGKRKPGPPLFELADPPHQDCDCMKCRPWTT